MRRAVRRVRQGVSSSPPMTSTSTSAPSGKSVGLSTTTPAVLYLAFSACMRSNLASTGLQLRQSIEVRSADGRSECSCCKPVVMVFGGNRYQEIDRTSGSSEAPTSKLAPGNLLRKRLAAMASYRCVSASECPTIAAIDASLSWSPVRAGKPRTCASFRRASCGFELTTFDSHC